MVIEEKEGEKMKANYYRIARINKDGFYEDIIYVGNIRQKPKKWHVVEKLGD